MTVAAYFVLTFLASWSAWTLAAIIAPEGEAANGVAGAAFQVLILIGTFAPALVAVAMTLRQRGRDGVMALLAPLAKMNVGARWYVFAVAYLAVVKLAVAAVYRIVVGEWPQFGDEPWYLMAVAIVFSMMIFSQSGEEVGWRGFALPRLAARIGYGSAALLIGAVWALWHLPLFYIANTDKTGQSFPVWSLQVMAVSVTLSWLYARTRGSLWLTMLMHAAINNTGGIVPSATPGASDVWGLGASRVMLLTTALLWVGAAVFLVTMPPVLAPAVPPDGHPLHA